MKFLARALAYVRIYLKYCNFEDTDTILSSHLEITVQHRCK